MWLSQVVAVTAMNLKNLRERRGSSAVAVLGIAGVVGIVVAVLSIAEGFRQTLATSGSPDAAIVLRAGATSEMVSGLGRDQVRIIGDAPGVLSGDGGSVTSAELFVVVDLPKRSTGTSANVPLRGVEPGAFQVRKGVRIVEGRMFEAGRRELIAGLGAAREFSGLAVGSVQRWGENEWTVVGLFEAGGTLAESELWTDVRVLQPAYRRGDSFQAVYARLESEAAFDRFKDALTTDPRLNVAVERETDYYAEQSRVMTGMITILGATIATIMGLGAAFGAVNTMYTAVSARSREIATLRALGFTAGPVVISVLAEALLLGVAGGFLGGGLAYLFFNGFATSTMNWQSFSQVAFTFAVTPRLLIQGSAYALTLGLAGGLFPAWRAARLPIASALREL